MPEHTSITAALEALTERLHRACLTVQVLPPDGPRGFYSTWPRYKLDWWDAEEHGSYRTDEALTRGLIAPPRFVPTPREVDDCLPALALMDGLPRLCRRVMSLRAHQLWYGTHAGADEAFAHWRGGWRMIGKAAGVSKDTAARAHWRAVRTAWKRTIESPPLRHEANGLIARRISRRFSHTPPIRSPLLSQLAVRQKT